MNNNNISKKCDVDIDFQTTFNINDFFPTAVRASRVENEKLKPHPAGAYFQEIPKDQITGLSAIPFKEAENIGFFKIDFLHLGLLDIFESKAEIRTLIKMEPDWSLLEIRENVEKLFQIHRHFDIVTKVKPTSINELADTLALIRPSKRGMLNAYIENKSAIREVLYKKPEDTTKYYFKRGHAISYALNIVLQLHLIKAKII